MTSSVKPDIRVLDPDTYSGGAPENYGLPLDQYRYLRDEEPCYLAEPGDPMLIDKVWIVSRYDDILAIDKDAETWAANRGFITSHIASPIDPLVGGHPCMLSQDGIEHRRSRQTVSKVFTPTFVAELEQMFRTVGAEVIERAIDKGTFNFVTDIAHAVPMEALGRVLGLPEQDRSKVFGLSDEIVAPFDERITPSPMTAFAAIGKVFEYAAELAELKRREPGDDVVTRIVRAVDEGRMTEPELLGNVQLMIAGAGHSTRAAMSYGMDAMMRNPDQMAWMFEHRDDVPAVAAREMARIATPFTHFLRTATRDVELHGKHIKAGERVCLLLASGNFDDRAFTDPERFDLSRDEGDVVFGRGPHICIGKHIAILEIRVLFEELFRRVKRIKPAGDVVYVRDNFARGVFELPVTLET